MIVVNFDPVDNNIFVLVDRTIEVNFGSANPTSGASIELIKRTGATILFDVYSEYNAEAPLISGNISIDATGAIAGAYVGVYYNGATEPSISGATGQLESGAFVANALNIYHFFWNTNGQYILKIQTGVVLPQLTAPTVVAVAGDTLVDLTFSNIDANATSNVLDRSEDNVIWTNVAGYNGTDLTYQDTGLTNGQIYYYRLKLQASGYVDSDYGTDNATPSATALTVLYTTYPFEVGYALFQLKIGQTYGIRLRRDNDDAETDVGFDTNGKISLSTIVSAGGTLSSWIGSNNGYITKRYNQGSAGATFDQVQTTNASQPQFISAGVIIVQDTVSMFEYDGIDDTMFTIGTDTWVAGDITMFSYNRQKSTHTGEISAAFDALPDRNFQFKIDITGIYMFVVVDDGGNTRIADSGAAVIDTNYKIAAWRGVTEFRVALDGSLGVNEALPTTRTQSQALYTGSTNSAAAFMHGYGNYDIIYKSDQSANLAAIEAILDTFL